MPSLPSALFPLRPLRSVGRVLRENLGSPHYYFGRRSARFDDAGMPGDTVLLIQGFFQTRRVMETLETRLRADGFRVVSFRLGGLLWNFNTRGVATLARRIDHKLRRLREGRDIGRVHIVGHSMGGLVGRYLVQEEGAANMSTR